LGPKFSSPLIPIFEVKLVIGEDGDIDDDSSVEYTSPKAVDSEGDSVTI